MNILINALGITNSGGITVLEKLLIELSKNDGRYYIVCYNTNYLTSLINKYNKYNKFIFKISNHKSFFKRFLYENYSFRGIIIKNNIDLVYNFTGSVQFTHKCPQLVKIQNLLFFSKKLDAIYWDNRQYLLWFKQVFLKRLVFKTMLDKSKYIEIQSSHVQDCLSDFIDTKNIIFYEKSDIDVCNDAFSLPRKYDFSKKIKFLYIVGPHFEFIHKNFIVFVNAMAAFDRLGIDYEINITLTKDRLHSSEIWDSILDAKTNFLGYISSRDELNKLFCSNTILISTSSIETLGLHVIEGIKNGVITIAPCESYARTVYGDNMTLYDTFNSESLLSAIQVVLKSDSSHSELILSLQDRLKKSEIAKHHNILDVFNEVLNVQK